MDFERFLQKTIDLFNNAVQRFAAFFDDLDQDDWIVFCLLIAIAFVTGYAVRSGLRRVSRTGILNFQNPGETLVSSVLRVNFGPPDYHLMNHVTLRLDEGTTQVDHILVSRFGVFVIETKDYNGWIFADAQHKTWTQLFFKVRFRFQNPIHQNLLHVKAVASLLDFMPPTDIKSVVVFAGLAEFKTEVPSGVFQVPGMVDFIREQTTAVMSHNRMQFCVGRLETARLAISDETDVEHAQNLMRRHGDTGRVGNRWY